MTSCPFCRSSECIPVKNSLGKHWVSCRSCKASSPHATTPEAAAKAWDLRPLQRPGVLATLAAKLKRTG